MMNNYVFLKCEGFDIVMVVNDSYKSNEIFDKHNRKDFFAEFYELSSLNKEGVLPLLDVESMQRLKEKTILYISETIGKKASGAFPKDYFSVNKKFLNKEYLLDPVYSSMAILGIDLYNINEYARNKNVPIQYITAETKAESIRIKWFTEG